MVTAQRAYYASRPCCQPELAARFRTESTSSSTSTTTPSPDLTTSDIALNVTTSTRTPVDVNGDSVNVNRFAQPPSQNQAWFLQPYNSGRSRNTEGAGNKQVSWNYFWKIQDLTWGVQYYT